MFYFLLIVFLTSLIATMVLFVYWIFAKAQNRDSGAKGKITLVLLSVSILLIVPVHLINGSAKNLVSTVFNHLVNVNDKNADMIIDASKFSRISSEELIEMMGEPDLIQEQYPVTYYVYDKEKFEFIVINNTVVTLSCQVDAVTDKSVDHLFSLFKISPGPNITEIYDNMLGWEYQMVNEEIYEFSTTFTDNITFLHITYDPRFAF